MCQWTSPPRVNSLPPKCQGTRPPCVNGAAPQVSARKRPCQQAYPQILWISWADRACRTSAQPSCKADSVALEARPLICQHRAACCRPSSVNNRPSRVILAPGCPQTIHIDTHGKGRARYSPRKGQKGPPARLKPSGEGIGPVSVGKALEARQGRDGRPWPAWLDAQHDIAGFRGRGRENPPLLCPPSVSKWISSSEVAMRDPPAVIVNPGDGAPRSSSDAAMVDRPEVVATLAGSGDAAARRARAGVRYCLAGSGDAREKKPPRFRAAPGQARAVITACNAPGRR